MFQVPRRTVRLLAPALLALAAPVPSSAVALPGGGQPWISNARDGNLLVISDSLGGMMHGAPFMKTAKAIAAQHPGLTVALRNWNNVTNAYDAPIVYGRGTGPYTFTIWAGYVGGSQPYYLFGAKRAAAIDAVPADAIMWQHGKNVTGETQVDARMVGPWENMRLAKPGVPQLVILEVPNRDDDKMARINEGTLQAEAARYGDIQFIDAYGGVKRLKTTGIDVRPLFDDNLHPDDRGVDQDVTPQIVAVLNNTVRPMRVAPAFLASVAPNLVANGDFSAWSGAVPDGWTNLSNLATATRDRTNKVGNTPYSLKLTGTAANAGLRYNFPAATMTAVAGQYLTCAVLINTNDAAQPGAGYATLYMTDELGTVQYNSFATLGGPAGGWSWLLVRSQRAVGRAPKTINVRVTVDAAANRNEAINYQRVTCRPGRTPADMAYAHQ